MLVFRDTDALPSEYRPNVGMVIVNQDGHVFLGRRTHFFTKSSTRQAQTDEHYGWQMPQGGIDTGETPRDALVREMREEIGTDILPIQKASEFWYAYDFPEHLGGEPFQKTLWKGQHRGQVQKWFLMTCTHEHESHISIDTSTPEFSAYRWASPHDALGAIIPFKRDVYEAVFQEFKLI